ncbi:dihydrodipicolinate reductase [Alkalilacustris brevis]|uniref:dihydrodipicolinate reductase n=1 Tax=Alkalilacustris brevis TaxID=2026338 RepID=UPI001EE3A941|nr:dihydrodipicolinate reductase [Alkalilacustris brevis]
MPARSVSTLLVALSFLLILAVPAPAASEFRQVSERETFLRLVEGRELRRFGIRLEVTPDGEIRGRAFGYTVTGAWDWEGGYFCRDMAYGRNPVGYNCQAVLLRGDTLRFISDQGQGEFADLRLR